MKNILQWEDDLKRMPTDYLTKELQSPTGVVPTYLVMNEVNRRKGDEQRIAGKAGLGRPSILEEALTDAMPIKPTQNYPEHRFADGGPVDDRNWIQRATGVEPFSRVERDRKYQEWLARRDQARNQWAQDFSGRLYENLGDEYYYKGAPPQVGGAGIANPEEKTAPTIMPDLYQPKVDELMALGMIYPNEESSAGIAPQKDNPIPEPMPMGNGYDRIRGLVDELMGQKEQSKGLALLRMGTTMMQTPGNFGQAMGKGMDAAMDQYASSESRNADRTRAAIETELGLEGLDVRKYIADVDADTRNQYASASRDAAMIRAIASTSSSNSEAAMKIMQLASDEIIGNASTRMEDLTPDQYMKYSQRLAELQQIFKSMTGEGLGEGGEEIVIDIDDDGNIVEKKSSAARGLNEDQKKWVSYAHDKALEAGLDPIEVLSLIDQESAWNPNAVSRSGATGLGQFTNSTARHIGLENRNDPHQSIDSTIAYLQELKRLRGDDYLLSYNAGPERVRKWRRGETALNKEQREYVDKVRGRMPKWESYVKENIRRD